MINNPVPRITIEHIGGNYGSLWQGSPSQTFTFGIRIPNSLISRALSAKGYTQDQQGCDFFAGISPEGTGNYGRLTDKADDATSKAVRSVGEYIRSHFGEKSSSTVYGGTSLFDLSNGKFETALSKGLALQIDITDARGKSELSSHVAAAFKQSGVAISFRDEDVNQSPQLLPKDTHPSLPQTLQEIEDGINEAVQKALGFKRAVKARERETGQSGLSV